MAKRACQPQPTIIKDLTPQRQNCPACSQRMWLDYTNDRTLVTLAGCMRLNLAIRRCHNRDCPGYLRPYRPEGEGRFALTQTHVRPGYHRPDRRPALCRASQRVRDPSGLARTRRQRLRADRD
jgi:hypothetical protein